MNLEEYFETKNSQDFPSEKDYVAIYRTFKQFMNSEIHNEVKAITTRLDNTVYLNDHSANHVKMVMVKVSSILKDCSYLTPYECFILLVAIQIHDAGHIFNGRDGHEKSGRYLLENLNVDTIERKIIGDIAKAHSGKNDPIGNLPYKTSISGHDVRIRELAALLRFGDELADENSRASSYLLKKDLIPEDSKLYHAFSEVCTTSIQIKKVIVFRWAFLSLRIKFKIDIRKVSLLFICWMKYIQEHSRHSRNVCTIIVLLAMSINSIRLLFL
jgi:hypothetical protein